MAGTLVIDTVKSSTTGAPAFQNTSGTEIGQLCKAWVNFIGSTGSIRASFNVSSVTRNGTGDHTVNFTNSLVDANYVFCCNGQQPSAASSTGVIGSSSAAPTSSALRINTFNSSNYADFSYTTVAVFR